MFIEKKFLFNIKILLILLLLLLIYSFDYSLGWGMNLMFPKIYFFTIGVGNQGWNNAIWQENGVIEILQIIVLFVTLSILIKLYLNKYFKSKLIKVFLIIEIIGITYIFFEEISWGQHFIKFKTPELFMNNDSFFYNKQEEFNLHNTSNFFNELPRSLILIWCSLSILIYRSISSLKNSSFGIIIEPNKNLLILSYLILILSIPDLIVNKLDLINNSKLFIFNNNGFVRYNLYQLFLSIISFNFIRFSELQELLFYYYFFWHIIFFKNALRANNKKNN
tara:strand:+ start:294 stop:1127 length:834 start_codon:yes stop_codon:yes gene_type:complete